MAVTHLLEKSLLCAKLDEIDFPSITKALPMYRYLISLICFLILLTSCAQSPFEWDGTKITKYKGKATEVVIPQNATEIGEGSFEDCRSLTSVVIPEGVTEIEDSAFESCRSLTSLVIPKSVTKIGDSAFEDCRSLTSVVIPEGVTEIGKRAFYRCSSLTSVVLPKSVKEIGDLAFDDCPDLTLYAPEGSMAEEYAQTRKDMRAGKSGQKPLKEENTAAESRSPTSRDSFEWNGTTITKFIGKETEVVIPEGTTKIESMAFKHCNSLTSVVIPEGVTTIDEFAFYDCHSLTSVTIPESLKEIGNGAFTNCPALKKCHLSSTHPCFKSDGTGVLTKDGKKLIFCLGAAKEYRIPEGVTEIDDNVFYGCRSLKSVIIPDSVEKIGNGAFGNCPVLKEWSISSAHPHFKSDGTGLLTKDGKKLIACLGSANEYHIPEGVVEIGEEAFDGCWSLTTVAIPDSVKEIGDGAFSNCPALKEWSISSAHPYFRNLGIALLTKDGKTLIACPAAKGEYRIPSGVTEIGTNAFAECQSLTSVIIPEGVAKIENYAFLECNSLTSVVIPKGMMEIGEMVFFDCSSLTSVVISQDVAKIGTGVFFGCSSLTSAVFLEGVTKIEFGMFMDCSSLSSVVIPASVEEIDPGAFIYCSSLKEWSISPSNPDFKSDGIALLTKDGKKLITCPGASGEYRIPEGVTEIGNGAFIGCRYLKSLVIPDSVEDIGSFVFLECPALEKWVISSRHPFFKSNGVALLSKDGQELIAVLTGVKEFQIPEGVTEIGTGIFETHLSLTSVAIPDSVEKIEPTAFANCPALKEWVISSSHPCFKSDGIALLTKDGKTLIACPGAEGEYRIPEGVTKIGDSAFKDCSSLTSIVIPEGVTEIESEAFKDCSSLTSAVIPKGVTEIEFGTFWGCSSLTSVVIPESVTEIDGFAFRECSSLTSVIIPKGVKEISYLTFYGCSSLMSVIIPDSVEEISPLAFGKCTALKQWFISSNHPFFKSVGIAMLTKDGKILVACPGAEGEYQIPEGVTEIDMFSFKACTSLTSIVIPKSVTTIRGGAFSECSSLTSVVIPDSVEEIQAGAFDGCSSLKYWSISPNHPYFKRDGIALLTKDGTTLIACPSAAGEYRIPEGVTKLGDRAFEGCTSLTSIIIPENITTVGDSAFEDCTSLTSFVFLEGVTHIGSGTLKDCSSLTSVIIPDSVEKIFPSAFINCPALEEWTISPSNPYFKSDGIALLTKNGKILIACPGAKGEYRIPEGVTEIGNAAFTSCSSLTSVVIPEGVTKIGSTVFLLCDLLKSIVIPESVKEIEGGAFIGCLSLKQWSISSSHPYFKTDGIALLTKDGKKIVACLDDKGEYRIPEGVTEIEDMAFAGCVSLTSVVIPESVTKIGDSAFLLCKSLTAVEIPEGVTEIDWSTFEGCKSLTSVIIPDTVTEIDIEAFKDCPNLTIYAPAGSEAERYAKENNIPFQVK